MTPLFAMEISQDRAGAAVVVAPVGRLDHSSAPVLQSALAALDAAGDRRIVLDLGGVDYISSAGLAVLFALAKHTRTAGGALALCALGVHVRRVIELAGYTPHFTITATRDEAIARV